MRKLWALLVILSYTQIQPRRSNIKLSWEYVSRNGFEMIPLCADLWCQSSTFNVATLILTGGGLYHYVTNVNRSVSLQKILHFDFDLLNFIPYVFFEHLQIAYFPSIVHRTPPMRAFSLSINPEPTPIKARPSNRNLQIPNNDWLRSSTVSASDPLNELCPTSCSLLSYHGVAGSHRKVVKWDPPRMDR